MIKGHVIYDASQTQMLMREWNWRFINSKYFTEEPYVFTSQEIKQIKSSNALNWQIQPAYMREAYYSEGGGVTITGNLEAFWD
jgi:hypothetical protein